MRSRPIWSWIRDAHSSLGIHVLYWGATYFFFVLYFGREANHYAESLLFVALLLPVAMATTYFATAFLLPRYLLQGRYALFALYGLYALIGSVYLELVVLMTTFILLAGYNVQRMSPPILDVFGLIVGLYAVVFLAVAADLATRWHRLRAEHDETERARLEAERARLEAELALREAELARLKGQMQPHFLFNTLNNLYGLTLERSDDAPEVVLRISEVLDYVLYRCDKALVPLSDELEHLKTHLELERLRYDERIDIRLDLDGKLPNGCIAPLLLTPFIENSFKHGVARTNKNSWVNIRVCTENGRLHFSVENGKPDPGGTAPGPKAADAAGIGLENVKRRLCLLYPDAHELIIEDLPDRYAVRLRIPIHSCQDFPQAEETA